MAHKPTPEENGKLVLQIYSYFNRQPGDVLLANNFVAIAARRHISTARIQDGIEFASRMKWIESTDQGFLRLTDSGFAAMPHVELDL